MNLDEPGITRVTRTPKVMPEKIQRQVGQILSTEHREFVTNIDILRRIDKEKEVVKSVIIRKRHYLEHRVEN